MNNATLIGNLCRDFETVQTQAGGLRSKCTIAVQRDRKEADGTYATDFFDIVAFNKTAEFCSKYCRKGDRLAVSGSVHIRDWVNKEGIKGRSVELMINSVENLTPKEKPDDTGKEEKEPEITGKNLDSIEVTDDDLPF